MFSSLRTKLLLLVGCLLLVAVSFVGGLIYFSSIERIERSLGEKAMSIARTAAIAIPGDEHQKVAKNIGGAATMPELQTMKGILQEIKKSNDLKTDIYTYIKAWWVQDQENIVFLASSTTDPFEVKGQEMEPYMKEALAGTSGYSDVFTTVNGEWITGYAPVYDSKGAVTGVVEVALETSKEVLEAKMAFIQAVALAAGFALAFALFLTFFVATSIAKPIISLKQVTQKMAGGDLKSRAEVGGKDEVAQLATDFNHMAVNLEKSYSELENYSKNLEKMVDERTAEVVAGKKKIQKILSHIEQGILTFGPSMEIDEEFSDFVYRFYKEEKESVAGKDVIEFILRENNFSEDQKNQIHETLNSIVGENSIAWDFNGDHLPTEATIHVHGSKKIIALEWTPMIHPENDMTERMMLAMRDLTTQRELEEKMAEQKKQNEDMMTMISELVAHDRDSIRKYFYDARDRMASIMERMAENYDAASIFRDLHTIKGGSRLLKVQKLMESAHLAEEPFQNIVKGQEVPKSYLIEKLEALKVDIDSYLDTFHNVLGGDQGGGDSTSGSLMQVVGEQVVNLNEVIQRQGFDISSISCVDKVVEWKPETLGELSHMIMHSFNNSLDHGYIRPKNEGSHVDPIQLEVMTRQEGAHIIAEIKDYGCGFDMEKIKKKAESKGYSIEGDKVLDVLFADGFSTADQISDSSGRGVGLPAIKDLAEKLGGEVSIRENEPKGASVLIKIPA